MGATFSRLKNWIAEKLNFADLNAEIDNILNNLGPAGVDDYSTNSTQMQIQTSPGTLGNESLAASLAGEIERLRYAIREIIGTDVTYWYQSPTNSLSDLSSAVGSGIVSSRIASGRTLSDSDQPAHLVANGAAATVSLKGATTSFVYYIDGIQYTVSSDVDLTGLSLAPSTNNTCLINDTDAGDEDWTRFEGEHGTTIPVDNMGSEISSLVGSIAAFSHGSEYFIARVNSTTELTEAYRGYFFDESDAAIPRDVYTNNDTITLLKLSWVFVKSDGTLTVTYTNPIWSKDEPSSPVVNDYWYDTDNETWKVYEIGAFVSASATLIGVCVQDTTNCLAARSFEFALNFLPDNGLKIIPNTASTVRTKALGGVTNVWNNTLKTPPQSLTWDMATDLDTGITEAASTYYYFYLTEKGDTVISDIRPYDRRPDLRGFYHPHKSWRCFGFGYNDGSSDLELVIDINNYNGEWSSYTQTGTVSTAATYTAKARFNTEKELEFDVVISFTGNTDTVAAIALNIPGFLKLRDIDLTFSGDVHPYNVLGEVYATDFGATIYRGAVTDYESVGEKFRALELEVSTATVIHRNASTMTNTSPFTIGNNDYYTFKFRVPIKKVWFL